MHPVNLVFSGGGVRGIAHIGVVKALQEKGMVIEAVSGVSSGAIAGAFIAAGYTPIETLEIFKSRQLFQFLKPKFNGGLFSVKKIGDMLKDYFPENRFEKLNLPLIVSCSDLTDGHSDYFTRGELINPLLASMAIPLLFEPVIIEGNQLVDGGFLNNFPVEPFIEDEVMTIGVHVNPWVNGLRATSAFQVMERVVTLSTYDTVKSRKKHCNVFLEPPALAQIGMFEYEKADEIFKIGYEFALKKLPLAARDVNSVVH